jgi:chromosomal replication initiator protein
VAECFKLTQDDLRGPRRDKPIAAARQIAMYLCRELSDMPYGQIGQLLGGRDHTTVQRGIGRVESLLLEDGSLRAIVQELRGRLER